MDLPRIAARVAILFGQKPDNVILDTYETGYYGTIPQGEVLNPVFYWRGRGKTDEGEDDVSVYMPYKFDFDDAGEPVGEMNPAREKFDPNVPWMKELDKIFRESDAWKKAVDQIKKAYPSGP